MGTASLIPQILTLNWSISSSSQLGDGDSVREFIQQGSVLAPLRSCHWLNYLIPWISHPSFTAFGVLLYYGTHSVQYLQKCQNFAKDSLELSWISWETWTLLKLSLLSYHFHSSLISPTFHLLFSSLKSFDLLPYNTSLLHPSVHLWQAFPSRQQTLNSPELVIPASASSFSMRGY